MRAETVHDRKAIGLPINARVAAAIVDDPYDGTKIAVVRSVRDDPLADMRSRGVIDEAMYLAGRKWQALHERGSIGQVKAIDTTKEPVDGGGTYPEPITDETAKAIRELMAAQRRLGEWGSILMQNLLAEHMTVGQMCSRHGCETGRKANFLSLRVRECLDDLAIFWGFAQRGASRY